MVYKQGGSLTRPYWISIEGDMRISIWQQFSSNHSSSIVLVGKFASDDEAQQAAVILRDLLSEMDKWYSEHMMEVDKAGMHTGTIRAMEPEVKFQSQYQANFGENSLMYWGFTGYRPETQIKTIGPYLFMEPIHEAAMDDPRPLAEIMKGLHSSETYIQLDSGAPIWEIRMTVTATIASIDNAKKIVDAAHQFFASDDYRRRTVWGWNAEWSEGISGTVELNGQQVTFDFNSTEPHTSLQKLLTYLEAQAATDINCSMHEISVWESNE